jgi:hypothetical protein
MTYMVYIFQESGPGYTLSGKLLDPHSAAAVSYGLKPEVYQSAPLAPLHRNAVTYLIWNEDPINGCQIGTKCAIMHAK